MAEKKHLDNIAAGNKPYTGGFFVPALCAVSVVALILRLIAAWEMAGAGNGINNILDPLPTSDLATYMKLGRECANGNFPETFYYQPYYYAVFLAGCKLISDSTWLIIVVQALLSAGTVFFTGWCGKKIFDCKAGLIAAGLCAVSSSLILYVPFCQNETLQTFHLILLFAATIIALEKKQWYWWGITGLIAGIAILTRGNIWLIIPVIIGGLLYYSRKDGLGWKKINIFLACFLVMLLVVQLPFIIHNSVNTGRLCGPSTAADAVLALGNTPEAPAGGREPDSTAGAMSYPESYHRMMNNTTGLFPRSVPRQMWDWFCDDPLAFCELQFRKALLFWDAREIPNNVSLIYDGIMCSNVLRFLFIGRNGVLFTLGIAGIFFLLKELKQKKSPELVMLYGFAFAFYAAVVVFYILSRFKAPFLPFLILFAAGWISRWIDLWKKVSSEQKLLFCGKTVILVLIGYWFSFAAYNTYRDCEAAINRFLYPDGMIIDLQGNNILHFDHGPQPFGGWIYTELTPGTEITKKFAKTGSYPFLHFTMLMRSIEKCSVELSVNGVPHRFDFPEATPHGSGRRMVPIAAPIQNGIVSVRINSVSGGKLWSALDIQRNYQRSFLNGQPCDGEWVIRAAVPR